MKVQEVIDLINNSEEPLYSIYDAEELIQGKMVKEHQDLDEHRWYSIATRVYEVEDGFVGIRGCYQSFSEMQMWSDCDVNSEAFEVKPVADVHYVKV